MRKHPKLSARQEAVLKLIRKGYLTSEIAEKLSIGESWVLVHLARIINKGVPINMVPHEIARLYKQNLSHAEIAAQCNIPERRVSQTISRLIRTLRLKQRPHWRHLQK